MTRPSKPTHHDATEKRESPFWRWFFGHVFSLVRRHGRTIIIWSSLCYIVRQAALALIAFAGKQSIARLAFALAANISIAWTLCFSVAGLSMTLYVRERGLHRKTRERLTKRNIELEKKEDPNRTSSNLTSQGLTRAEDE